MKKSELVKIVREVTEAQSKTSGDVIAGEKAIDSNSTTSKALLRYNNATEFYDGFKEWIQNLGITSTNNKVQGKTPVTKGTVLSAVNKALADLNWK
jgi:hypothetical protein